jgi:hypothetical protein
LTSTTAGKRCLQEKRSLVASSRCQYTYIIQLKLLVVHLLLSRQKAKGLLFLFAFFQKLKKPNFSFCTLPKIEKPYFSFLLGSKFRSKFRFRAIFRDFWFRSRQNHFFRYRFLPDFLIKETEMRHRCDIDVTVVSSIT